MASRGLGGGCVPAVENAVGLLGWLLCEKVRAGVPSMEGWLNGLWGLGICRVHKLNIDG